MIIIKAVEMLLIVFLMLCIGRLYKVLEKVPDYDKGWVALGILSEVSIIIQLAIGIILN